MRYRPITGPTRITRDCGAFGGSQVRRDTLLVHCGQVGGEDCEWAALRGSRSDYKDVYEKWLVVQRAYLWHKLRVNEL